MPAKNTRTIAQCRRYYQNLHDDCCVISVSSGIARGGKKDSIDLRASSPYPQTLVLTLLEQQLYSVSSASDRH